METVLEMLNICKNFPGVRALDNVSIEVKKGEVHGLVGENGAGKSTLIKILSGAYISDSGVIKINGEIVKDISPHNMILKGVAVIYQELMLAPHMTVGENIFLGHLPTNRYGKVDYEIIEQETVKVCELLGLKLDPKARVCELSVAQRQMIEIAKALSRNAKIIVLDEPTAVLGENELKGMFEVVRRLAKAGVSFIYISHRLKEVFQIADSVTIMKDGQIVGTDDIRNYDIEKLVKGMVGRELKDVYPVRKHAIGKEVLKVEGLSRNKLLHDINLTLHEGEILSISGLSGAGRTEILRAIVGADNIDSGEIEVFNKKVLIKSPREAIALGIGILPEDRKVEGLFLSQTVAFNISISKFNEFLKGMMIKLKDERKRVTDYIQKLNVRPNRHDIIARNLSGGNQQKVVFARWLNAKCKILLVDEPTRGIDVGAKQEIYRLLNELAMGGVAVLVVSSELPEVLGISDRILVMWQGRIVANLDASEASEELIMSYATGQMKSINAV